MWMPPERRKPAASGKTAGFQKIEMQDSKIDGPEDTHPCVTVQAIRLRQRYGLTWPVARLVASLHYGAAA